MVSSIVTIYYNCNKMYSLLATLEIGTPSYSRFVLILILLLGLKLQMLFTSEDWFLGKEITCTLVDGFEIHR